MAVTRCAARGRGRARRHAGVLPVDRLLLRHVQPRAGRRARRRGLHEPVLRALRCPGGPGRVRRGLGVQPWDDRDGQVTLRTIECAGGCGRAPVVVVDHVYHEPVRAEDVSGRWSRDPCLRLARTSSRRGPRTATSRASTSTSRSALRVAREGARNGAAGGRRRDHRGHTPRTRRGGVPDGSEGLPPREGHGPARLPRRERRRVGAGCVQGPGCHALHAAPPHRGLPHHGARHRLRERVRVHPGRVPARVRGDALGPRGRAQGEAPGRGHDRPAPRRRRVHLRRGDGAARVARGLARPASAAAALPARHGPLRRADADQQREHDRARAQGARARRGRVLEDRRPVRAGDGGLLPLGQRRAARELRAPARRDATRADLRRWRGSRTARAEGRHPGRVVRTRAHTGRDRHADGLRLDRGGGLFFGSAAIIVVDDRCCMVQASARRSSTCTSRAASARRAEWGRAGSSSS